MLVLLSEDRFAKSDSFGPSSSWPGPAGYQQRGAAGCCVPGHTYYTPYDKITIFKPNP
ncbi:hypothetical protein MAR_001781 [Mya arenaria]|uniref:Uncharacterized protein n=1 Tax=Mya arenaria TaxID=6604 RepID=A0ABY7FGU8_MYAAR|nr:hypothetical protein MAR_001781 [Mya arenaria]